MIRRVVDFALNNRLLVLAFALILFAGGIVAFRELPIEAYPDVADNYVEIITQWPGISAEQIEQQVTIPLEISMNGIPHVVHLRSFSLFGLSDLKLVFDDEAENDWNRERVLERLSQVTLPPGVVPQMGTDWSPVGQIYFFTLHSTNPAYDPMELKSIEDWVIEKHFKAVPDIVDVASFGGPTREYQVRVDPNKLVSYGLSLAQVEQQLTNNNVNAGGSFIQEGLQQVNVRSVGLVDHVHDIEETVILTKNGTPLRVKDIAVVSQGPKIRLGQFARAIHHEDGKIVDSIIFYLSSTISHMPGVLHPLGMYVVNILISMVLVSASGMAMATMPVMAPVGDLLHITRQTAVLMFQCADGMTHLILPTSAATMGALAAAKIPFERWIKWVWPLFLAWIAIGGLFVMIAFSIGYK